ncbi:TPA: hypothetical protein DEB72_03810 [Patescibacteria group bacterium]|nr:hypothetical protein [Patescibacteria group bacterium]
MLQSKLFTKTSKTISHDDPSVNARLLTKAGFIDKQMSGAYSYLPLGFRVLNNIENIIRQEMNAIGAQELIMTSLQPRDLWETTKRWVTSEEIMYKFQEASGQAVGLAWTHEEAISKIASRFISSYRDLPRYVYQIQTKFRNEPRAKSGILRTREFLMKDLYSFHATESDLDDYYDIVKQAYTKIFTRCGLKTLIVEASGGAFTKQFSHEFQVLTPAGEDNIIYCDFCNWAQNKEVAQVKVGQNCPECDHKVKDGRAIEVGNIFKLGTKFSEAFGLKYTDESGNSKLVIMASYGIGPGRVMGSIVEVSHDDDGILWPHEVAPFPVHLIAVGESDKVSKSAQEVYKKLTKELGEVLYDDRVETAGIKFKDADLIGVPWRIVVSEKTGSQVEIKARGDGKSELVSLPAALNKIIVR